MLITLSPDKLKGMTVGVVGMVLATVGLDPLTGTARLNFGVTGIMRGLELVPVVVGLFGIAEILVAAQAGTANIYKGKLGKMTPRGKELKQGLWASVRGLSSDFSGICPAWCPP